MERRVKIMYLKTEFLSTFLNWRQAAAIQLPVFPQLPADAAFGNISYDFARQAVSIIVHSKEFDIVPDAMMPPVVEGPLEFQTIELQILQQPEEAGPQLEVRRAEKEETK